MSNFRHSLPIRRVRPSPELQRIHVEVLTIEIDPLGVNELVYMIYEPLADLIVSQLEQAAPGAPRPNRDDSR